MGKVLMRMTRQELKTDWMLEVAGERERIEKMTYGEILKSLIFMSHESQKRRETVGSIGMGVNDSSSTEPVLFFPSQKASARHE